MFSGDYDLAARDGRRWHGPGPGITVSQRHYELEQLVAIYRELAPRRVLEIGTQEGGTLYQWLANAPRGAHVVNVDILQNQPYGIERLPATWQSWVPQGVQLTTILRSSHDPETLSAVRELLLQVDFLFIDGDHTYEGARQDWETYGPLVRRGGIVAFHDLICPGPPQEHIQVGRLWREIQRAGYVTRELYAGPGENWGGIGVVYA